MSRRKRSESLALTQDGSSLIKSGQYESAINVLNQAIILDPLSTSALTNLGTAQMLHGDQDKAEATFDAALSIDPQHWPALTNSALIKLEKRQSPSIIQAFQRVTSWSGVPDQALLVYARSLIDVGQFMSAYRLLTHHRRRLSIEPEFWLLFGIAHQFIGLPLEAAAAMRKHVSFGLGPTEITSRYARLIADCGDYGQARNMLARQMVDAEPSGETGIAYARVKEILGDQETPTKIYEDILSAAPNHNEALTNLGNLSKLSGDYARAESLYRRALQVQETSATSHKNLADLLGKSFRQEDAVAELARSVELAPNNPYNQSDFMFAQHYLARMMPKHFKAAAARWGEQHDRPKVSAPHSRQNVKASPLRIGLLSGSFRRHPVSFLALAGLEKLDDSHFSITCYANQAGGDAYTDRFRTLAERWRPVAHISDDQLAAMIQDDRIDILIEMSGHASGHRLPVVARRVAPVQVKWIGGQFNTMGIDAIDYFLSDPVESPESHDADYFERIHRLPDVYACYEPPRGTPDVSTLPALGQRHVTFGSLNKTNKISPETAALWSQCLEAVPGSRLILQNAPFDDQSNIDRAHAMFAEHGIESGRIQCMGFTPHPELFQSYHQIDIALDPYPYSGCLTTCESLWMGVPVVTLPGPTFAGRHSASFLTATGLEDWIAADENDYVRIVSEQSADQKGLSELRQKLRQTMAESPLCDSDQFAAHLAKALNTMWLEKTARVEKAA